jgi:hypothetical protein
MNGRSQVWILHDSVPLLIDATRVEKRLPGVS